MQDAVHKEIRRNGAGAATWRLAISAALGGLALTVIALPVGFESGVSVGKTAFAASETGGTGGNAGGKGPATLSVAGNDAESALAESDESVASPAIVPTAGDKPANANVIKEIAGLAGDEELSDEEEREAIRSGWGTWRTADGPETVLAQ